MQQLNMDNAQNAVDSTFYDRFAGIIFQYLLQQVSNEQDAEDLLLEVFLAALQDKSLTNLPGGRQLAWLRRVARNKVIDRYRHVALLNLLPIEQALELEAYNRTTGGQPINVAFLSGSQRFRVAVALALGIGQYASRQHRPIESVIIDEGFGCLDRNGRQVMIQELQNLRGHLQCILLVSHQEEFAEAFADGYRFELADGATRVTRLQR